MFLLLSFVAYPVVRWEVYKKFYKPRKVDHLIEIYVTYESNLLMISLMFPIQLTDHLKIKIEARGLQAIQSCHNTKSKQIKSIEKTTCGDAGCRSPHLPLQI